MWILQHIFSSLVMGWDVFQNVTGSGSLKNEQRTAKPETVGYLKQWFWSPGRCEVLVFLGECSYEPQDPARFCMAIFLLTKGLPTLQMHMQVERVNIPQN